LISLTDRSIIAEEKRRLILDAAVRVFARKGFHTCRVGDISEEAGVAHGLLYHYFSSKDELLETIFRETWSDLLAAIREVEASEAPAREQLRQVAAIMLRAWRRQPDLVRVLVRDVARSPALLGRVDALDDALTEIAHIVERGQADGEFRPDLDPRLASLVFYGGIETILTSWVLGRGGDDEDVARAERAVVEVVCAGLAREPAVVDA
jgi:TetR/AcrR family transcriptional regulator, fatty acid metabolism regulator protein